VTTSFEKILPSTTCLVTVRSAGGPIWKPFALSRGSGDDEGSTIWGGLGPQNYGQCGLLRTVRGEDIVIPNIGNDILPLAVSNGALHCWQDQTALAPPRLPNSMRRAK